MFRSIEKKVDLLKSNPECGTHIQKDRIPKDYLKKYDVNNLWKLDLQGAWRMIYTLRGKDVEIIALILNIFDHKGYERKFRYKG